MKKLLIIKDMFNDAFTDYKDKLDTVTLVVDTDDHCDCLPSFCGICKLIAKHGLVDLPAESNVKQQK